MATANGSRAAVNLADLAVGTLELGLARYADALSAVTPMADTNMPGWTCLALPIAVEAAARSGRPDLAEGYLEQLRVRTEASGTNWALGQLCRCRAFLAGSKAEPLHQEAIRLLAMTSVVTELAQAHLATVNGYGGRADKSKPELSFDPRMTCSPQWVPTRLYPGRVLSYWLLGTRCSVIVLIFGRASLRKKVRRAAGCSGCDERRHCHTDVHQCEHGGLSLAQGLPKAGDQLKAGSFGGIACA